MRKKHTCCGIHILITLVLLLALQTSADNSAYDPLLIATQNAMKIVDLTVNDPGREREIPIRVYLPSNQTPAPVILFSHGLGGSREGSAYLGRHWAARGYIAVFLQHPGSDSSVWKNSRPKRRLDAMREAASPQNFLLRVKDIPAVLDRLERWNESGTHILAGRLNLEQLGMSGHSFGAVTTQAVSGQSAGRRGQTFTDARIKAALIFSPSSPRRGWKPEKAFGSVAIPWMLITGTQDLAPIGDADMESRLAVFPALTPGGKYELVLHKAEHSAFTDHPLPDNANARNPNHHRAILALSTAFWDAWMRGDPAAKHWLDGDGPATVLEEKDRWQKK